MYIRVRDVFLETDAANPQDSLLDERANFQGTQDLS